MRSGDWARLAAFLAPRFHRFEDQIGKLAERGQIELTAQGEDPLKLHAELINGMARIRLTDPGAEGQGVLVDGLSQRAIEDEIDSLRRTVDAAPVLVWREDAEGNVIWANRAYLLESGAMESENGLTWPLPKLFSIPQGTTTPRRCKIDKSGKKPIWFECHSLPSGSGTMHYGLPADAAVQAEVSLREFIQTLTKTFAHLPIGLAIFDKKRQLALFNPALIDLTTLGAEFLSARPTLFAFLDQLREARMMPEPKDYRSWRQQMNELEKAAASGLYEETWTLPSGQTYHVTGRPHPDGAVAFLIEDITAEISLTRRFRAELEMGQAVIDSMEEAIAVFSPDGVLTISNEAYAELWGVDPGRTLGEIGIIDAMRHWQDQCDPTPIWADARDFVSDMTDRTEWSAPAQHQSAGALTCRFVPLARGATLVGFRISETAQSPKGKKRGKPTSRVAAV